MALMDSNLLNNDTVNYLIKSFYASRELRHETRPATWQNSQVRKKNTLPSVYRLFNKRIKGRSIGRVIMQ